MPIERRPIIQIEQDIVLGDAIERACRSRTIIFSDSLAMGASLTTRALGNKSYAGAGKVGILKV